MHQWCSGGIFAEETEKGNADPVPRRCPALGARLNGRVPEGRKWKLSEIAEAIGAELSGDPDREIRAAAPIESAQPDEISFVANPRYRRLLAASAAGAVILAKGEDPRRSEVLFVENPYLGFARALELFDERPRPGPGVHASAVVDASARLGARARVGAFAVVGEGVVIGEDAVLHPHVVIYPGARIGARFTAHAGAVVREGVEIGDNVVLQPGAVVGGDGFGFVPVPDGPAVTIPQIGGVRVGSHVDVGSNTTIDRAAIGQTVIGDGVKLDNLVMIAHGCSVGEGAMLAAQFGMAGSSRLGARVMAGGQVGVGGHIEIGDDVRIAAQSGIVGDVKARSTVAGSPAVDISLWRRYSIALRRLPELLKRLSRLERAMVKGEGGAAED